MLEEQEQKRLLSAVYGRIGGHVGCAVVFPSRDATLEDAMKGPKGTISFIDTGTAQFALTCDHVWQEFMDTRSRNPQAELVVIGADGHESFSMSDAHVIASGGKQLDLITLDVPNLHGRLTRSGKQLYQATAWPPPLPVVGDSVIAMGYPGAHQRPERDGLRPVVQLRPYVLALTVSSVSNRHAVLAENTNDNPRRLVQFDPALDIISFLGGISGSAVFVHHSRSERLVGVIYEASSHGHESRFYVAHSSYILADGRLDFARLPLF